MTIDTPKTGTEVGNYFVSNYPPFSQWKPEFIGEAVAALGQAPRVSPYDGTVIRRERSRRTAVTAQGKPWKVPDEEQRFLTRPPDWWVGLLGQDIRGRGVCEPRSPPHLPLRPYGTVSHLPQCARTPAQPHPASWP